jgi:Kef-type K+ transport system membrane component KefB
VEKKKESILNKWVVLAMGMGWTPWVWASSGSHEGQVAEILLGLLLLFLGAKLGGYLAIKCKQPAVLGELFFGILLGNLYGIPFLEFIRTHEFFSLLASIGVVLLLFEVGLESSMEELMRVGVASTIVAVVGVVVPFALGYWVSHWFMPERSFYVHLFTGATLSATSVGITARVLKDLGRLQLRESKIILGAAVIDDVLGLIILAVVGGLIASANLGGVASGLALADLVVIVGKAVGFLLISMLLGSRLSSTLFRFGGRLQHEGMWLSLSISYCFFLSYLAYLFGLAPIVGAFAAGLTIDMAGAAKLFPHEKGDIEDHIVYLARFFVPIFFVHTGMGVDLRIFGDSAILLFGLVLTLAAILGKQVCGWAIWGPSAAGLNRALIGIGMIPRGEVGLIFAMYGLSLTLDGQPVVDKALYSSIVLMVMLTTIVTPPALTWALRRKEK